MKNKKLKVTLNEVKRMQQLAGIKLEENDAYDYFFGDDDTPKSNSTSSKYKNVPSLRELEEMMKNNRNGDLRLRKSNIETLPQGLKVKGNLNLIDCTSLKELPKGLKVGWILYLQGCTSLKELPQGLEVKSSLHLDGCTSLKELPKDLKVGDGIDLTDCTSLKEIPQELSGSRMVLVLDRCTSLKELPKNLQVFSISLEGCTSLKELPQGLKLNGELNLRKTPIAKKYSEEQIRSMIENGGGYVKGGIKT